MFTAVVSFTESPAPCCDPAKDTDRGKNNLPPETSLWSVKEVMSFFSSLGFPEEAKSFQNQVSFFFFRKGECSWFHVAKCKFTVDKVESETVLASRQPWFLGDAECGKSFSWILCVCLLAGWPIALSICLLFSQLSLPQPPNSGQYDISNNPTDCFSVIVPLVVALMVAIDTSSLQSLPCSTNLIWHQLSSSSIVDEFNYLI